MMRAEADVFERRAVGREQTGQAFLHGLEVFQRVIAPPDPGLIGDHEQGDFGPAQAAKRRTDSGEQPHVFGPVQIAAVFHQGAVAVEKDVFNTLHCLYSLGKRTVLECRVYCMRTNRPLVKPFFLQPENFRRFAHGFARRVLAP